MQPLELQVAGMTRFGVNYSPVVVFTATAAVDATVFTVAAVVPATGGAAGREDDQIWRELQSRCCLRCYCRSRDHYSLLLQ